MPSSQKPARSRPLLRLALHGALALSSLWGTRALCARPRPLAVALSHRVKAPVYGPVDLYAPALRERLRFRPYDGKGRPRKFARRELTHFLRCSHTGAEHPVDLRLMPVLYRMGQHYHRPLLIFSGYRPPQLSTRPHSRHLSASAIDFRIPGVRNDDLVRWLRREFHPLGVGFYPDGVHVHLDVDRRYDAYWVQRGNDAVALHPRAPAQKPSRRG